MPYCDTEAAEDQTLYKIMLEKSASTRSDGLASIQMSSLEDSILTGIAVGFGLSDQSDTDFAAWCIAQDVFDMDVAYINDLCQEALLNRRLRLTIARR